MWSTACHQLIKSSMKSQYMHKFARILPTSSTLACQSAQSFSTSLSMNESVTPASLSKQPFLIKHQLPKNGSNIVFSRIYDSSDEALKDVPAGATIMFGGFGLVGIPENLIKALNRSKLVNNITVISNEGGVDNHGLDILLESKRVKKMICSFLGQNKELQRMYLTGELGVELVPQGTLVERIRCGGAGIPAFYTPTGVNTQVHLGGQALHYNPTNGKILVKSSPKESRTFNDKLYLMETALKADFAFIKGWKADKNGNVIFRKTACNFNVSMAKAAKITIVEVEEIVEIGELDPDFIHLPGIYVDRVVKGENYEKIIERRVVRAPDQPKVNVDAAKERIARRAALEFQSGMYANLGIGLPVLTANYIPKSVNILLQAENGILGMGPNPSSEAEVDSDIINPGKETVTILKGGAFFSTEESFNMIRGNHLDLTMLGAMQVSKFGDLANWTIPGKLVRGMGGAMDLVASREEGQRVIVLMTHNNKKGDPKILEQCSLPLTGFQVVDMIITDKCVFTVSYEEGLTLTELAEGLTVADISKATDCDFKISPDLKQMPQA